MCAFKPTVSDDNLLIIGYANIEMNSHSSAYKIPVATIIASINKPCSESTSAKWIELITPNHWKTTIVPTSSPPVIVGGENSEDMSIADINMYDESAQAWKHIGSLSSPRSYTAIVAVHDNAIIIFGGHTEGGGVAKAKSSSLQATELGQCKPK